jgi:hypothetical protein
VSLWEGAGPRIETREKAKLQEGQPHATPQRRNVKTRMAIKVFVAALRENRVDVLFS